MTPSSVHAQYERPGLPFLGWREPSSNAVMPEADT